MPGAIDTHAHVYPAMYLAMLEQIGVPAATTQIARNLNADSTRVDLAKRIEWMDRAEVETQVISVSPQIPSGDKPGPSAEVASWINDEYARIAAEHPRRFLTYATLPLPHLDESITELNRALDELGMVGASFPTVIRGGISIAAERFEPLWQELNRRAAVVNIHPTGSGACSRLITDFQLEWVNGAPVEDAVAVLQLLKADIPARYPRIRFHIAHLGGDLPFLGQRLEDNYADWGAFAHSPHETLRRMWFDAANFYEPSLRLAREYYGPHRVMAGSDYPYFQEERYVRAFTYIRESGLSEGDRRRVLRGNAAALYGFARWAERQGS